MIGFKEDSFSHGGDDADDSVVDIVFLCDVSDYYSHRLNPHSLSNDSSWFRCEGL